MNSSVNMSKYFIGLLPKSDDFKLCMYIRSNGFYSLAYHVSNDFKNCTKNKFKKILIK